VSGSEQWRSQAEALGAFIRAQRQLADLSLREMAAMTDVSNAYLSQVERGLHQPSVRVLNAIATALRVSTEELFAEAGLRGAAGEPAASDPPGGHLCSTVEAITADPRLTDDQRRALLSVYHSFVPAAE
jgi:transcriptional regulator with XRE-family HTH domain